MPEGLRILEVLRVNNKSIDITLNRPITDEIQFVIEGDNDFKIDHTGIQVTDNSYLGPIPNTKTLMFIDDDNLLELDKHYRVIATDKLHLGDDAEFVCEEFPAMIDADLNVYGDRVLKVSFEYPVRNLGAYHRTSDKLALSNFYILYYNMDSNASSTNNSYYPGSLHFGEGLEIRIADDLRSIEIQNPIGLANGDHSFIINYNKDYQNRPITDYAVAQDYLGRPFPVVKKAFSVRSGQKAASVTAVEAVSRTEILVTFDGPVVYNSFKFAKTSPILREDDTEIDLEGVPQRLLVKYQGDGQTIIAADVIDLIDDPNNPIIPGVNEEIVTRVIDGIPAVRYGRGFNQLLFKTEVNPKTALLPMEQIIKVKGIQDANGFLVREYSGKVNPPSIKPRLLSVDQKNNYPNGSTLLEIIFSELMDDIAATDLTKYDILDANGVTIKPIKSIKVDMNSGTFDDSEYSYFMEIDPELSAGEYTLVAAGIKDRLDVLIDPTTIPFIASDYTVPRVEQILAEEDVLVIKYSEPMNIGGEHSILAYENYLIEYVDNVVRVPIISPIKQLLDTTAILEDVYGDKKAVRITTKPQIKFTNLDLTETNIHIGYCRVKDIKYVTNSVGNICEVCAKREVDRNVEPIEIAVGVLRVIDNDKLEYQMKSGDSVDNEILKANKNDFAFKLDDEILLVDDIKITEDRRGLILTFNSKPFDSGVKELKLFGRQEADILTKDLFDKPVVIEEMIFKNVPNKIESTVTGISLIGEEGDFIKLAMKFTQEIVNFGKTDFYVSDNLSNYVKIEDMDYAPTKDTLEFTVKSNPLYSDYKVSVAKAPEYLLTIDKNLTPIKVFKDMPVMEYSARKLIWEASKAGTIQAEAEKDLNNSKFTVTFDVETTKPGISNTVFTEANGTDRAKIEIAGLGTIEFFSNGNNVFEGGAPTIGTAKVEAVPGTSKLVITFEGVDNKIKPDTIRRAIFKPEEYAITDKDEAYYINSLNAPAAGLNL